MVKVRLEASSLAAGDEDVDAVAVAAEQTAGLVGQAVVGVGDHGDIGRSGESEHGRKPIRRWSAVDDVVATVVGGGGGGRHAGLGCPVTSQCHRYSRSVRPESWTCAASSMPT